MRRLIAVGLWLCATGSATAIVWAGTSTVAADLTDRPPPVVAHRNVVMALQPGASDAKTAPGITTPNPTSSTSTVPSDDSGSGLAVGAPPEPGPARSQAAPPGAATAPPPAAPPTTQPGRPPSTPPTTKAAPRPTATYSTAGGVTTVACNGFFIELVSATPRNGYAVNVASPGPYYVEVHFVRAGQDDPLWVYCLGQPIRAYGGAPQPGQPQGKP